MPKKKKSKKKKIKKTKKKNLQKKEEKKKEPQKLKDLQQDLKRKISIKHHLTIKLLKLNLNG